MRVIRSVQEYHQWRTSVGSSKTVGWVATLGALHRGHLALVRRAQKEVDYVVASIYLNPTQFAEHEDFDKYPKDEEKDLDLLRNENVDVAFLPTTKEIYPNGLGFPLTLSIESMFHVMEGKIRPHFFHGVARVVTKFMIMLRPDKVFFGQKDGQQAAIVKALVKELLFPITVVVVDTVRETSGVALSSRNVYLGADIVKAAGLYRALKMVEGKIDLPASAIKDLVMSELKNAEFNAIEYVDVVDWETLAPVTGQITSTTMVAAAVKLGSTRLIDNVILRPQS